MEKTVEDHLYEIGRGFPDMNNPATGRFTRFADTSTPYFALDPERVEAIVEGRENSPLPVSRKDPVPANVLNYRVFDRNQRLGSPPDTLYASYTFLVKNGSQPTN